MAPPPKKATPGVVSQIGRAVFGIILLLPMVVVALLCLVLRGLSHVGILAVRTREGTSLVLVQSAWRLSLLLCPWVWVTSASQFSAGCKQLTDARAASPGTAFFVLANHTSFFDTILGVAKLPTSLIYHTRTYMATHLFNLPILSTICISCGHFPVAFSGSKDGDFRVDREAMAVTQARVDEHIKVGGWRAGGGDGCERDSERETQRGRMCVCVVRVCERVRAENTRDRGERKVSVSIPNMNRFLPVSDTSRGLLCLSSSLCGIGRTHLVTGGGRAVFLPGRADEQGSLHVRKLPPCDEKMKRRETRGARRR